MVELRRRIYSFKWATRATLAILALLALLPGHAAASKRVALLVANAAYVNTTRLGNPPNDIAVIAAKLRELGFNVRLESNLDARRFAEVLQDFSSGLDKDTDALFYYAGHGLQFRGENLLVGVDARLQARRRSSLRPINSTP